MLVAAGSLKVGENSTCQRRVAIRVTKRAITASDEHEKTLAVMTKS